MICNKRKAGLSIVVFDCQIVSVRDHSLRDDATLCHTVKYQERFKHVLRF